MQISYEVIDILEYLCSKFGLAVDWSNNNILPYVEQLCDKFIKWEIGTSIAWIIISIMAIVLAFILMQSVGLDGSIFSIVLAAGIVIIGVQIFDIIKCCTFPEKAIYDYIQHYLEQTINSH